MQDLRQFIKSISPEINDLELDYVVAKFKIKSVEKNKFIIKRKQTCAEFVIVKKGLFRIFYLEKDKEINSWFAFEKTPVTEMHSFITRKPTEYSIQALEDSEIYSISYFDLHQLYKQFNSFQTFGLRLTEQILVKAIERLNSFQFETAEERYNKIIINQNFSQRIPLKEIASFLGITPNSLSRLRKSNSKK